MRLLKIIFTLAACVWSGVACDGSVDSGTATTATNGPATLDQTAPNTATQQAPNTATQQAPNTATQQAPNTATQRAASGSGSGSGSGTGVVGQEGCATVCNRAVAMGCGGLTDCTLVCDAADAAGNCAVQGQALLSCANAATNCDQMQACGVAFDALMACTGDGNVNAPALHIADPSVCKASNTCQGCTAACDACICMAQLASATVADVTLACGTMCPAN